MSEGGKARHPAGEPGSKSREDFDELVSRAAEARAHGESHVSLSEGAAEVEAAVKAEAERLGYRPGEFIDDHMAIARAALDAVRCAQGRDTDAPEAGWPLDRCGECGRKGGDGVLLLISDVTKHPPLCFECRDLWYPPARSPQGEDHDAMEDATAAFSDASGWHLYPQIRRGLAAALPHLSRCPSPEREIDRLRAGISFVRGLCTDRASYSVIDERLGELLDGETT